MARFYLADAADTLRLSIAGTVEPTHVCEAQYFGDADSAYAYCDRVPGGDSLKVWQDGSQNADLR